MRDSIKNDAESDARFEDEFKVLTGYSPMRWQKRLFQGHFVKGLLPSAVSVPTGLGKTAVMAIWLAALAQQMQAGKLLLPRRLVYVVDRRAVVDQATQFAEDLRTNLGKPEAKELRAALGLSEGEALPISTLRGQFVDNREWLQDPSRPAIVVGTVDMIGSRLLFEGYGVSRKMRPYHAGLLGADTLVLLDEAHLVPPFEALLAEIAGDVVRYGARAEAERALVPPFKLLPLSATGRRPIAQPFLLEPGDFDQVKEPLAHQRLFAKKRLTLQALGDKKLAVALAEQAWALSGEGEQPVRVIVYCNLRENAEKTKDALDALIKKAKGSPTAGRTELFVGARRVKERDDAETRLKELGFLAGSSRQAAPAFLVATSAGEVGIDLDSDHMVCDLVAWERMVQRLGRVNRRGGEGRQAEIVVLLEPEPEPKKAAKIALEKRNKGEGPEDKDKKAIEEHEKLVADRKEQQAPFGEALPKRPDSSFDVSPEALRQLSERVRTDERLAQLIADASSSAPLRPALNRALVDAWSMTSLPEHTGRPEVQPWLRGWVTDDPQTTVVWRKFLPLREGQPATKKEIEDFFEAAPIHASETLETETYRVMKWLQARAAKLKKIAENEMPVKSGDVVALVLKPDGAWIHSIQLWELAGDSDDKKKRLERIERDILGKTLVVRAEFAGLQDGLLDDAAADALPTADGDAEWRPPVDDKPVIRFRISEHGEDDEDTKVWRESLRFVLNRGADGEATRWLSIQKWRDSSNNEDDRAEGRPQTLVQHQSWAAEKARAIARRLGLSDEFADMLCVAARLHDEGKRAKNWQRAFRAERDAKKLGVNEPLAKTRGPINQAVLGGYRHEFGSLPLALDDAEFNKLSQELQDLALHLIAAHHGQARPLIGTAGCEDAPPSKLEERARDVALRYARLQKCWGPWGLAWWEALLRAADAQASRDNDEQEGK
ncbi:MAG: type I-U CRISPR-associated helicase/endonuclease Cas3 [Solimonas sp.]